MNPVYITSGLYLVAVAICLLALTRRGGYEQALGKIETRFSRFAARPLASMAALFLGVFILRVALLALLPVPTPEFHDEFSFLLLGDTIAHGRLTDPTPALWKSFETFHENMYPTYCSKYAPAQGFVLALGEKLGNPWIGVLLSCALMVALFHWALRVWMPARWAFLTAILVGLKLGITSYWMNSFWGGAVPALAGALALGGLGRILKRPSTGGGIALGAGIAILANSRPYEGLIFSIPVGAVFLWWMAGKAKSAPPWPVRLRKVVLPATILLAAGIAFVGYYNWRTTGSARTFAMSLNQKFYDPSAIFIWETPGPPMPHYNPQFDDFYNRWQRNIYGHNWTDLKKVAGRKVRLFARTYLWWDLLLIVPALYFILWRRKLYPLWASLAFTFLAFFLIAWTLPHYVAPAICVVFAIFVISMRHLRLFKPRGYAFGLLLSRLVVLGLLLQTANAVVTGNEDPLGLGGVRMDERVEAIRKLESIPGKHLVFVRYAKDHNVHHEWVFNGADIEGSRIVWARELNTEQNQKLIEHFRDRNAWFIEADRFLSPPQPYAPPKN
ncbi:MAG TPA: hypothetical protein VN025_12755 [Candidatus Dormibacteraeota bacterium]|jgi:hypothetical protein|nr:hypothetical protein [Candidatus Dormibacteraeota bacterium]